MAFLGFSKFRLPVNPGAQIRVTDCQMTMFLSRTLCTIVIGNPSKTATTMNARCGSSLLFVSRIRACRVRAICSSERTWKAFLAWAAAAS